MARKRYKPEEIVAKLRQVDVLVSQGQNMVDAIRQIGVSEVTYYRCPSMAPQKPRRVATGRYRNGFNGNAAVGEFGLWGFSTEKRPRRSGKAGPSTWGAERRGLASRNASNPRRARFLWRHEKFRLCPFSNGVRQQGNSYRPQTKGPAADGARFLP